MYQKTLVNCLKLSIFIANLRYKRANRSGNNVHRKDSLGASLVAQ